MQNLWDLLQIPYPLTPELKVRIWITLLVTVGLWVVQRLLRALIEHQVSDPLARYNWRKNASYFVMLIGLLTTGVLWIQHTQATATFLGLVSAGLAIALREPAINFSGWIFIKLRRLFDSGDRIQIGDHAGDVIDIRLCQFTLLEIGNWVAADQSTGRILHIPNGWIFDKALANYHKGLSYIWHEIPIHLTFDSNWEKAKTILQTIADKHAGPIAQQAEAKSRNPSSNYLILYNKLTPIVYTRGEQNGVLLTIRYLCEPRRRRSSEQALWEDILRALIPAPDIHFAYPTQQIQLPARASASLLHLDT